MVPIVDWAKQRNLMKRMFESSLQKRLKIQVRHSGDICTPYSDQYQVVAFDLGRPAKVEKNPI